MLRDSDRQKLRKYSISEVNISSIEDPIPEFVVPDFEEIKNIFLEQLSRSGWDITRTAPNRANALIRVYRKENYVHDTTRIFMYGAECITNTYSSWSNSAGVFKADYENCLVQIALSPEKSATIDCEFVDYYFHLR